MGVILCRLVAGIGQNWDEGIVVVNTTTGRVSQQVYSADLLKEELDKMLRSDCYDDLLEELKEMASCFDIYFAEETEP